MIDYELRIEAPIGVVYEMLTDPRLLSEWMADEAESDSRPGGSFRWAYENGDVVRGRFVELDPPRRLVLAYGWEQPVTRGIPPGSTVVEITLDEEDGATTLRLVHRGLPPGQLDAHGRGWGYFLGRLATRLAAGSTT